MPVIQLLATAEVATALERDVRTVHRLIESGVLIPVFKLPGKTGAYLFDPSDIDALKAAK